jgi:hypothetical protein
MLSLDGFGRSWTRSSHFSPAKVLLLLLLLLPAAGAAEVKREPRPRERHNEPSL